MRVINGIECIGSSPRGRGCSTKDFDVKITHQKKNNSSKEWKNHNENQKARYHFER